MYGLVGHSLLKALFMVYDFVLYSVLKACMDLFDIFHWKLFLVYGFVGHSLLKAHDCVWILW